MCERYLASLPAAAHRFAWLVVDADGSKDVHLCHLRQEGANMSLRIAPPLNLAPGSLLVTLGPGGAGKSTFANGVSVGTVGCLSAARQ